MPHPRRARALVALFALSAAIFGTGVVTASAAHAGVADVTCTVPSSKITSYSPALTADPQSVTVTTTSTYDPCVSLSHPDVTFGSEQGTLTATLSCLDLLSSGSVTHEITWNTGQTSTYRGDRVTSIEGVELVNVTTGSITSGLFEGDTFVQTQVAPATPILDCDLRLGTVSTVNSSVTLEITSP